MHPYEIVVALQPPSERHTPDYLEAPPPSSPLHFRIDLPIH